LINFNFVFIYLGHIRASKKTIIISSIGLIFSLGVIASTLIYIDSSRELIFQQAIEERNNSWHQHDISMELYSDLVGTTPKVLENKINNSVSQAIKNFGYQKKLVNLTMLTAITNLKIVLTFKYNDLNSIVVSDEGIIFIELNDRLKEELSSIALPSSEFPRTAQEGYLLFINNKYGDRTLETPVDSDTDFSTWDQYAPTFPITLTGIATTYDENLYTKYIEDGKSIPPLYPVLGEYYNMFWSHTLIFVHNLTDIVNTIQSRVIDPYSGPHIRIKGYMDLNLKYIDVYNVDTELKKIDSITTQIFDHFYESNDNYVEFWVNFESEWYLRDVKPIVERLLYSLVLFAFPIVIVSLFVANYSFGLINKSITRHIGIYKTRGASAIHIFAMLITDFFLIILLSVIASIFIIGYPIASLILHTDDFLSFNAHSDFSPILMIENLLKYLFITGIILGLIINFFRISRLSRIPIAETENPVEKGEPYWKKHYLDFIFLGTGIIGYWVLYTIITQEWFILGIFSIILLPTPILLVIGVILLFSRLFPIILSKLGGFFWEKAGNLVGFAFKNVIRHKQASTRAVMLIAVLVSFMVVFFVFPSTSIKWNYDSLAYKTGAEGVGIDPFVEDQMILNETLLSILQTNYSDYFSVSPFVKLILKSYNGNLLAINSTSFLDAALFPISPETSNSLQSDMNELGKNNTVSGIILNNNELNRRNAKIGDQIILRDYDSQKLQNYQVIDSFNYWPRLYLYYWGGYDDTLYGVIDLDTLISDYTSSDDSIFYIDHSGFYFNFKDNVNQTKIANWLAGNFSLDMSLVEYEHNKYINNITFLVLLGQLNANIIISLLIGVTVLLMFAYMQLKERSKEIFTERALGMKLGQLSALFLIESIILLVSGLVIGNILGIGLSWMFGLFITQGTSIPPLVLYFPWDLIFSVESIIIVLALIGSLIPAWIITQQDISTAFAGE
jgi:ABC-type lipoprotein release transport system permease subunit